MKDEERGIIGKYHATHLWANQRCSLLRSTPLRMVVSAGGYNEPRRLMQALAQSVRTNGVKRTAEAIKPLLPEKNNL